MRHRATTLALGLGLAFILLAGGVAFAQQAFSEQEGNPWIWLPDSASTYSPRIDYLYKVIFWVTTGMFVLVEGLLLAFCVIYRRRPGHRPVYTHGNTKAEVTWTVVPGLMLLGLAIWQIPTWNDIKKPDWKQLEKESLVVDVFGEQFKWNFRYPGAKEKYKGEFDYTNLSQLHVPFGQKVMLNLRSKDVIHSVYIPAMRVKQDTTPGLRQRIWFQPNRFKLINLDPKAPLLVEKKYGTDWITKKPLIWREQQFEWVGFDPGAPDPKAAAAQALQEFERKYAGKRVAVGGILSAGYWQKDGFYQPLNPAAKIRTMVVGGKIEDAAWSQCDYALGVFEIACAELCGEGHYTMRGFLVVEPPASFDFWLKDEVENAPEPPAIWKLWRS